MLLRVVRFRGMAPDLPCVATFTQAGGTIGRSTQCTLSLPDPDRHISRIQAEINYLGSQFYLVDRGTANPIQQNGSPVGQGKSVPLQDGDELHIGDYVVRVECAPAKAPLVADPFADLMAPSSQPDTSWQHGGTGESRAVHSDSLIPEDFDPFSKSQWLAPARVPETPAFGQPARNAIDPPEQSLDALFGLDSAPADPLGIGTPLGQPLFQPNTSVSHDPMAAFGQNAAIPDAPVADLTPEIHGQFRLPQASSIPNTAFMSWDAASKENNTLIVGKNSPAAQRADNTPASSASHKVNAQPAMPAPGSSDKVSPQPDPTGLAGTASGQQLEERLIQAFLDGAGLTALPANASGAKGNGGVLNEQLMYRVGELLRLYSQGTLELLAARATIKSGMRAEVTIIGAQANNPLKFSPDAAIALNYLLAVQAPRGFMSADRAVKDAMNDLVAHQLGVMAGMRAALHAVLHRFEPMELEQRISPRSVMDAMLLKNRKAKLWETFEATFQNILAEAEDEFETLFSREFVKAYEAQIHHLDKPS